MGWLGAWAWAAGTKTFYVDNGWTIHASHDLVTDADKRHLDDEGNGGAYALQVDTNSITVTPTVSTSARWFHAYVVPRVPASPQTWLLHFLNGGGGSMWVRFNNSGTIQIFRGTLLFAATLLGTSADAINPAVGHWIAVYANLAGAGGEVSVYVDGALLLSVTGNTQGAASPGWTGVGLAHNGVGSAGYTPDYCITDIIITDDGPDGILPEYFTTAVPVDGLASGNLVGSPTTGADRWQNVDDAPASTGEYNEGTTASDADAYTLASPTFSSGVDVGCVVLWGWAERGGALTQIELGVDSGGGMSYSTPDTLPASGWEAVAALREVDPTTTEPWETETIVDGLQLGVRFT